MAAFPLIRWLAIAPLLAAIAPTQDPTATVLVEDTAGKPLAGAEVRWVARDPRQPHRLDAQIATTDARGQARLVLDRPTRGPIHALVTAGNGLGAFASLARGDAQRIRLSATGSVRIDGALPEDVEPAWALTRAGHPLPLLKGHGLNLPQGRYLGTLRAGREFHACAFRIVPGEAARVIVGPAASSATTDADSDWAVCPRGRAELSVRGKDPLGLPPNPEIRLDCWRERDGVLEVRPWPGEGTPHELRTALFDSGPVVVVTADPDRRGWTISGPGNPVQVPADATTATLWSEEVWQWPLDLAVAGPIEIALPASRSLELAVVAPDGSPQAGAKISWHPVKLDREPETLRQLCRSRGAVAETLSDGRGIARLDHTAGAEGLLFVDHPNALPHWIEVGAENRMSCQLEAGGAITGRIEAGRGFDADGGVGGVRVWARSTDRGLLQPPRWADTDAAGHFAIRGLDPDLSYTVTASLSRGVETYSARAVRIATGAENVELRLATEDPPLPGPGPRRTDGGR